MKGEDNDAHGGLRVLERRGAGETGCWRDGVLERRTVARRPRYSAIDRPSIPRRLPFAAPAAVVCPQVTSAAGARAALAALTVSALSALSAAVDRFSA